MEATPYPNTLLKTERCLSANIINLNNSNENPPIVIIEPIKPHSSPMVQKMKSVLCSGTKLNLVWVPPKNPFPKNPPEPIAILDW